MAVDERHVRLGAVSIVITTVSGGKVLVGRDSDSVGGRISDLDTG